MLHQNCNRLARIHNARAVGLNNESPYQGDMKLFVIPDIFAHPAPADCISARVSTRLDIERHSLGELCGRPDLSGEALHQYLFAEEGMRHVLRALVARVDQGSFGLGYSAGGTALWRAVHIGLPLQGLFCVSSTRLRHEAAISVPNHVFFGALDPGKPSAQWLSSTPDRHTVFEGCDHDYYVTAASKAARQTCASIEQDIARLVSTKPDPAMR